MATENVHGRGIVYTDGACSFNQSRALRKAGIGVWFGPDDPDNVSRPCSYKATNNWAELEAIEVAVRIICTQKDPSARKAWVIRTDSAYARSCILQYIHNWMKNDGRKRDGKRAEHYDIVLSIAEEMRIRCKRGRPIELVHIPREKNAEADRLAKRGSGQSSASVSQEVPNRASTTVVLGVVMDPAIAASRTAQAQLVRDASRQLFGCATVPPHCELVTLPPEFLAGSRCARFTHIAAAFSAGALPHIPARVSDSVNTMWNAVQQIVAEQGPTHAYVAFIPPHHHRETPPRKKRRT